MTVNKNENRENKEKVYGNESFGIPSDCTQKQKFSGIKLVFYIVLVVALCVGVYAGFQKATHHLVPTVTFDKTDKPLVYTKTDALMGKHKKEQRSRVISDNKEVYEKGGSDERVFVSPDTKYVFHPGELNENNAFDLFCYSEGETVSVAKNVNSYKVHPKARFVLYIKNSVLYISDMKKQKMISPGVSDFYFSKNGQQVIYFKNGGRMYTCATGENLKSVLVDTVITKLLTPKDEYADIYYIKENSLYHKKADEISKLLAENIFDAIVLGENVYFTRKEAVERLATEFIDDDLRQSDSKILLPVQKDFIKENEYGAEIFDKEGYTEANKEFEQKVLRDTIRYSMAENFTSEEEFVLYNVRRDEEVKIDSSLADGYLKYNSCKDTIVYKKFVRAKEKIKLSEIESVEDAVSKIEAKRQEPMEICMQVLVKGKRAYMGTENFPDGRIEISLDGKYIYFIDDIGDNGKGTLVRYSISPRELKGRTELKKDVTDFVLDGSDSEVTVIFDGGKMGICENEKYTHLSDLSCYKFFYVDGSLFFYDNFNNPSQTGQLKMYRDGKIKLIDSNVRDFDVRNYRTVSYIKNYNHQYDCGDLFVKEGNQKRKIDFSVRKILY